MGLFESKPAPSASGAQDDQNDVADGGAQDDRNDVADGGAQDGFGCDLAGKRFASAHQAACYRRSAAAAATRRERRAAGGGPAPRAAAAAAPAAGAFHASAGPATFVLVMDPALAEKFRRFAVDPARRYLPGLDVDGAFADAAARGNALAAVALAGAAPGAAKRALDASPGDFLATRLVQRVLCATDRVWGADAGGDGAVAAAAAAALARYGGAKATVAVRAQPRRFEKLVVAALPPGTALDTQAYDAAVHVFVSPAFGAWVGVVARGDEWFPRRVVDADCGVAAEKMRAAHKLREVLAVGLDGGALAALAADPGGCVVDVGAAPGGWTSTLAAAGVAVLAVDPAALNPGVAAMANVTHARKKVEDLTDADYPAGAVPKGLVCDVNAHPAQLVETIAPLVRSLPPGAPVVLTLKFGGKGHEAASEARKLTHAAEVLADLGDVAPFAADFRLEWLVSNTKRERTLIAFRA